MATTRAAKRDTSNLTLPPEKLEEIYTTMRRIRAFEERTADLFEEGLVKGTAHSYIGEEAIAPRHRRLRARCCRRGPP